MNILVIGNSWGTYSPWKNYNNESRTVVNIAVLGQSNIRSLNSASSFLIANNIKFDLIVWYVAGLMRDHTRMDSSLTFNEYLDILNTEVLERTETIRKDYPDMKWAVIGTSPIHDVQRYAWTDFIVENWIGDIFKELGETIPTCQSFGARFYSWPSMFKEKFPHLMDDINKEIESDEIVYKLKEKYPDVFVDGIHPNLDISTEMCDKILDFFKQ